MIIKLSHAEAKKLMDDNPDLILADVRTPEEFGESYIDGAVNVPLDEIGEKAAELLPHKNAAVMVYCQSGKRSKQAAEMLENLGYEHIYDMGGITEWPFEIVM